MNKLFRYITVLSLLLTASSCSKVELDDANPSFEGYVEYIVRPISYTGYEVCTEKTKSFDYSERNALQDFEEKITSAYCLVFGNDGNRVGDVTVLTVTDNTISSKKLYHNYEKGPLTVCFLANVPQSYANSIEKLDDFATKYLEDITYSSYQTEDKDIVIVPEVGGTKCVPMFGYITQSYSAGTLNGVSTDQSGNHYVTVHLERLFARVNINLVVEVGNSLFQRAKFDLNSLSVKNLPTKLRLKEMEPEEESAWVKTAAAFAGSIELDPRITVENGLIITPSFDFTCYVPEYVLLPEASEVAKHSSKSDLEKQKTKPTLFDESKYPFFVEIKGKVSDQPNFVDVPVEYNIYLGENAFDSFSLYRNNEYNNNIIINDTKDAILGTDHRVVATYHNLADPDNTGTDNPANCYIISKPGRYLLPTYIGNDVAGLTKAGTSVEQIAINGGNNTISNIQLVTVDGENFIQFDVNMSVSNGSLTSTSVVGANKLLVLKNGSNVVWSWHLWMCDDALRPDLDESMERYPNDSGNWNNEYVMNRALGATNSITLNNLGLGSDILGYLAGFLGIELNDFVWQDGLYYQWGRKDPLLPTANNIETGESSYENSKQNPQKFYTQWNAAGAGWSSTKSIDDPCPPGYMIPSKTVFRSSNPDASGFKYDVPLLGEISVSTTTNTAYTYNLTQNSNETSASGYIFYPYGGHYKDDGSFQENVYIEGNDYTDENVLVIQTTEIGDEYSTLLRPQYSRRIKNIQFEYEANVNHGTYWATDRCSLEYGYSAIKLQGSSDNIFGDFISNLTRVFTCDYQQATITYTTSGFLGRTSKCTELGEWSEWQSGTISFLDTGHSEIRDALPEYLSNLTDFDAYTYSINADCDETYGCQVRCVKE